MDVQMEFTQLICYATQRPNVLLCEYDGPEDPKWCLLPVRTKVQKLRGREISLGAESTFVNPGTNNGPLIKASFILNYVMYSAEKF